MKLIIGLLTISSCITVSIKQEVYWGDGNNTYSPSYFSPYPYGYGYSSSTPGPTWTVNFRKEKDFEKNIPKEISSLKADLFNDEKIDIKTLRKNKKALSYEHLKNEIEFSRLCQLEDTLADMIKKEK